MGREYRDGRRELRWKEEKGREGRMRI